MGKLKKAMAILAGCLSALSIGGGTRNVFAASAEDVKATINNNDELKEKPFSAMTAEEVNNTWGTVEYTYTNKTGKGKNAQTQQIKVEAKNSIADLQKKGHPPISKKNEKYEDGLYQKDIAEYLKNNIVWGVGNGLLCKLNGEILTYGDVFTDNKSFVNPNVPILAEKMQDSWGLTCMTSKGEKKYYVGETHLLSEPGAKNTYRVKGNKLITKEGNYCKVEEDGDITVLKGEDNVPENATTIENSTFGFDEYEEIVEPAKEFKTVTEEKKEEDDAQPQKQQQQEDGTQNKNTMSGKKKALIGAGIVTAAAVLGGVGVAAYKHKAKLLGKKRGRDKAKSEVTNKSNIENKSDQKVDSFEKAF